MNTQDPITIRFIEVFNWLKQEQKVRSARQFALGLSTYPQSLNDILKGRREATLQMIQKLTEVYNINSHYLLTGQGCIERTDVNGISTCPKVSVTYLKAHEFCAYASAADRKNLDDHEWSKWELPQELLGQNVDVAIQCNTDRVSSGVHQGDLLFLRKMPQSAWKSSISSKRIYLVRLVDNMHIIRVEKNDADGFYLQPDDRDLPLFIPYEDIKEVWSAISKWSHNVNSDAMEHISANKIADLTRSIQSQNESIVALTERVLRMSEQREMQSQF